MNFEAPVSKTNEQLDREAENELQELLDDPENKFLEQITLHKEYIENCPSSVEALAYAKKVINQRLEETTIFRPVRTIEGIVPDFIDKKVIRETVLEILANQHEIGRGGDAFVVIDKNEVQELPPEICYKFALEEATPRGRNSMDYEAEIHGIFYDAAMSKTDSKIGVPIPFYMLEIGSHKMIAMEKLPAVSLDDLLRGLGRLPDNFDVDEFCKQLHDMFGHLHSSGLYHRDMHPGNIMITQKDHLDENDMMGYLIDFGLSAVGLDEDTAYSKTRAGSTFTYSDDYGIINFAKSSLSQYKVRISS